MTKSKNLLDGLYRLAIGTLLLKLAINLYAGIFSLKTVKYFAKTA